MIEILTSAQMRAVEAAAIDSGQVTGLTLMERAGAAVVAAILAAWPEAERRAVVLCGPGNNGGDGYVIARRLVTQGWQVTLWAPLPAMTPDAAANAARWAEIGPVLQVLHPGDMTGAIVVDALFGTGLTRPIGAPFLDALTLARQEAAHLVAVDILSGLCADTGRCLTEGAPLAQGADLTVSFQATKCGHMLLPAAALTGALQVVDIGLSAKLAALAQSQSVARAAEAPKAADLHKQAGHKFSHGHLLVLGGGVGRGGAARLAARAALRAGAGLVTLACPPAALIENAARLDAVMLRPLRDATALPEMLDTLRITALCLGPGLGLGAREAALVAAALESQRPLLLDADALTLIAQHAHLRAKLHAGCVLTPHEGEFRRLWPARNGDALSKIDRTVRAARDAGAVVLLKGADTVIAAPVAPPLIHAALRDRAAPDLATAGSGDVLAGLVAGLLARSFPPRLAASAGAWLHVEAARQIGPGLIAEDLPDALPAVLRALR